MGTNFRELPPWSCGSWFDGMDNPDTIFRVLNVHNYEDGVSWPPIVISREPIGQIPVPEVPISNEIRPIRLDQIAADVEFLNSLPVLDHRVEKGFHMSLVGGGIR